MIATEVIPRTMESADVASDGGRSWLARRYSRTDASYVRVNMITSVTGSAAGVDGTSETLSNRVDRAILGVIRRDADVVLVGAQSVRAEGYTVPRTATLAIVTASGDLDGHRLVLDDPALARRILLVCPAERADELQQQAERSGAQVLPVSAGPRLAPDAILEALAGRGLRRVVCEGGPSLASQFVAAGVVDEYCLTVSPAIEPASQPFLRIAAGDRPETRVAGMLVDEAGFSYLRLRRAD